MKIDDRIINYEIGKQLPKSTQSVGEQSGENRLADKQTVEEKGQAGQDTIVHLSSALKETQLIKEIIASEPAVREDKILELKQRIESGNYKVNHKAVASKIVDSFIDEIF